MQNKITKFRYYLIFVVVEKISTQLKIKNFEKKGEGEVATTRQNYLKT